MARIVIVDDHPVVRTVLRQAMVGAGHEVVGEAEDGAAGIELVTELRPDLVLMDVSMPGVDGISATRRLVRRDPTLRVLMVTMHAEAEVVEQAREAGAAGYLLKDVASSEMADAADRVLRGEHSFPDAAEPGAVEDDGDELSERETDVLRLLAEGQSPQDVAAVLAVSPRSVAGHLARIYEKLGVQSRAEAVRAGRARGVVPDDPRDEAPPGRG